VYEIMARMSERGWSLNGLHHALAAHIAVTLRHTKPGVVDRFLSDLSDSVDGARASGGRPTAGAAPMYGMVATFPARGAVNELMARYIDKISEIDED
jgi:sphinganine-1-phosphate aldolase